MQSPKVSSRTRSAHKNVAAEQPSPASTASYELVSSRKTQSTSSILGGLVVASNKSSPSPPTRTARRGGILCASWFKCDNCHKWRQLSEEMPIPDTLRCQDVGRCCNEPEDEDSNGAAVEWEYGESDPRGAAKRRWEEDDDDDSEDSDDDDLYSVDKLLDVRTSSESGITEYLVRWAKPYADPSEDSWEPEWNIVDTSLITEYLDPPHRIDAAATRVSRREPAVSVAS